jgi:hypothetical protein
MEIQLKKVLYLPGGSAAISLRETFKNTPFSKVSEIRT